MDIAKTIKTRDFLFLIMSVSVLALFYSQVFVRIYGLLDDDLYSHIVLIPFISAYFIYAERERIFFRTQGGLAPGAALFASALLLYILALWAKTGLRENDYLSVMVLSALAFTWGGFLLFYGMEALKKALFPLLFLLFMVPIPTVLLEKVVYLLQVGSAEVSYGIIRLSGMPVLREGFVFHLPEMSIEVAEECSGIRSSLAVLITGVMAGHMFLKSRGRKVVLILTVLPVVIIKNGIRISTLALLASYVDRSFITNSFLHKNGGVFFFVLALLLLTLVVWVLRNSERRSGEGA